MAAFPEIPGYEIQAELGRGGMAVVYAANEIDLDRPVAIKVVRADAADAGHMQRLENEARGLAALHHPHIVDLYRFGRTADGGLYYVMPLLSGGSLEDRPRPMPEPEVIELLDHLLDALEHAHASDIIHRDIKPANILFDRLKRPMLADFGAAFMRQRSERLTTHGGAIGSTGYMSPEQARGQEVDARSDLYSTAVLAFELLTGSRPWDGPDGLAVALAQIEQPVPRLADGLRHWQPFFDKALSVNPAARYANAAAMRAAMRNLRPPAGNPLASSRLIVGLALAAFALVAFAFWKLKAPASPAPGPAVATAPPVDAFSAAPPRDAGEIAPAPAASTVAAPAPKPPSAVGDRFADPGGPEVVLARAAKDSNPALAVMAAPVDQPTYGRYLEQRKRAAVKCTNPAAPAQGCLDLATAKDVARWMSEETGEKYRVPTRSELEDVMPQVVRAEAYAWTGSCNEVRIAHRGNAAQRGWNKVRKAFGKPKPVTYDVRCDGNFTLKLDGKGKTAQPRTSAVGDTVVVLVREMRKQSG